MPSEMNRSLFSSYCQIDHNSSQRCQLKSTLSNVTYTNSTHRSSSRNYGGWKIDWNFLANIFDGIPYSFKARVCSRLLSTCLTTGPGTLWFNSTAKIKIVKQFHNLPRCCLPVFTPGGDPVV